MPSGIGYNTFIYFYIYLSNFNDILCVINYISNFLIFYYFRIICKGIF